MTVASPTVSTEGMIGSYVIDSYEGREIGSFDIPGTYLHTNTMKHNGKRVLLVLHNKFCESYQWKKSIIVWAWSTRFWGSGTPYSIFKKFYLLKPK